MNKEKYLKMRNELMNSAKGLIDEGNTQEAEAKMKEVEDLDNKWEETKKAQANLRALQDNQEGVNLENQSKDLSGAKQVDSYKEYQVDNEQAAYETAWAKNMMGKKLNEGELDLFNKVNTEFNNAYTHDTGNSGVLIPETVASGIWSRAEELYPLYADVKKYAVQGKLTMKKHTSIDAGDATWYDEDTATADEENTFGELTLDGHELSKSVTVSWKLKAMAVQEFIPYIINELGERVGVALGNAVATGSGTDQPTGVETVLLSESGSPQVVTYDPEAQEPELLVYEHITRAIGKIHSSYLNGSVIYANNATIWDKLANLKDDTGRPLFIPDVTSGGVGRMFGMVVKPDAGVTDGSILIGNANKGYVFNTNEPFSVVTEDHAKARTTDYVAYSIVDGDVLDSKAFALIQNVPNA